MKKLPSKYYMPIFMLLMTLFIGASLSAIMLWLDKGFIESFVSTWLRNFFRTWIIVLPIVFITMPLVQRITKLLAYESKDN
ncbi:DUF2798 domain-containing protein [Aggregatimonas sangjinii]|uniref:DUF2798 domain-containing protein n=1 Tax=Aggregatimonas sangjinii TaxID=2583587 RepID=A0A5B7SRA9_9FLAO|nr:DUF2798 domain-containing protein [Aggregatimonas sangjinii]